MKNLLLAEIAALARMLKSYQRPPRRESPTARAIRVIAMDRSQR